MWFKKKIKKKYIFLKPVEQTPLFEQLFEQRFANLLSSITFVPSAFVINRPMSDCKLNLHFPRAASK